MSRCRKEDCVRIAIICSIFLLCMVRPANPIESSVIRPEHSPVGVASRPGRLHHGSAANPIFENIKQGVIQVDGVQYTTAAQALSACQLPGCVIDLRGNSSPNALTLGTFDPGPRAVTLLLGPYTYTVDQITLRANFEIIGMGAGTVSGGQGTIIQSGSPNQDLFVVPSIDNYQTQYVYLKDLMLAGAPGSSAQSAIVADTSTCSNCGLFYSVFEQIEIAGTFAGGGIVLKGSVNKYGSLNEWDEFRNITIIRARSGGPAVDIEGENGQLTFLNCEFDGAFGSGLQNTGTNVYIGVSGSGSIEPFSIHFIDLTSQLSDIAIHISDGRNVIFDGGHFEVDHGVFLVAHSQGLEGPTGIIVRNSDFENDAGVNSGSGYLLKVATNTAQVIFSENQIFSNPDHVIENTNGSFVTAEHNIFRNAITSPVDVSSGVAFQITPAATLNIGGAKLVRLNQSTTPISNLLSTLGPGEIVSFRAIGTASFATGGNIDLGSYPSPLILGPGESATFIWNDVDKVFSIVGTSWHGTVYNTVIGEMAASISWTRMVTVPGADTNYLLGLHIAQTGATSGCKVQPGITVEIAYTDALTDALTVLTPEFSPPISGVNPLRFGDLLGSSHIWSTVLQLRAKASTDITYSIIYGEGAGCLTGARYSVAPALIQE